MVGLLVFVEFGKCRRKCFRWTVIVVVGEPNQKQPIGIFDVF